MRTARPCPALPYLPGIFSVPVAILPVAMSRAIHCSGARLCTWPAGTCNTSASVLMSLAKFSRPVRIRVALPKKCLSIEAGRWLAP